MVLREARYTVPMLQTVLVDGIHRGPQVDAASAETGIRVQVVERNRDGLPGFQVLPG
jgi:hypothetical protein